MQIDNIYTKKNNRLILFFNGWAMDSSIIRDFNIDGYDIIECHDYSELPTKIPDNWNKYSHIYVIAWSMGVWAANQLLCKITVPCTSIAICGTYHPISNNYGIPVDIFNGTTSGLTERSKAKFDLRMCGDKTTLEQFKLNAPKLDIEQSKNELMEIRNQYESNTPEDILWDKAIIGSNDHIFPSENQQKFWETNAKSIVTIDLPHYPFAILNNWKSIIDRI